MKFHLEKILPLVIVCSYMSSLNAEDEDTGCVDDPIDWVDILGNDCSWYEISPSIFCDIGDDLVEEGGITANDACCACGGGTEGGSSTDPPSTNGPTSPSTDPDCVDDPIGWVDSEGFNCGFYAQKDNCLYYGDQFENDGYTANEACCACITETVTEPPTGPTEPPTDPTDLVYGLQPSCNSVDDTKFNLCLDLVSTSGNYEEWMDAYGEAKNKWESVIVGDLEPYDPSSFNTSYTGTGYPGTIDDIYISGKGMEIDGWGGVLGQAGPRYIQKFGSNPLTGEEYWVTISGEMQFDTADIEDMVDDGSISDVITHEMAHVIGIGLLWDYNGLYTEGTGTYEDDTYAKKEWEEIGCTGHLPVELDGGEGTANGHWDEECLVDEMMTGYSSGSHPLSKITIGSLEDMGYQVDYSQADSYTLGDLSSYFCGSYCPAAKSNLRSSSKNKKKKKVLSEEGQDIMKKYALQQLSDTKEHDIMSSEELGDNIVYVGGDAINVLYREDGEIFSRMFTKKQLQ